MLLTNIMIIGLCYDHDICVIKAYLIMYMIMSHMMAQSYINSPCSAGGISVLLAASHGMFSLVLHDV